MLDIPKEILEASDKCPNNFKCKETGECGDPIKCEVDYCNGENVIFLKSNIKVDCPYRLLYADRMICNCPTHFYIKYRT